MNFLIYILQSAACAAILWLAYFFLMRKETCYIFNRFYLLAIIPISVIAPLLQLPLWPAPEIAALPSLDVVNYTAITINMSADRVVESVVMEPVLSAKKFPSAVFLLIIYCAGVAILSFRIVRQLYKLYHLSIQKKSFDNNKYCNAFTFFRKIYINREFFNAEDYDKVLLHEQAHAQQLHSLDLVLAELFAVFQFFNPFAWQLKKSLAETHEYYADAQALACCTETDKYKQLLYNQAVGLYPKYAGSFNNSLTKKRLMMMTKTKPGRWLPAKLLCLMLVTAVLVLSQAGCKQTVKDAGNQQNEGVESLASKPVFKGNIMEYLGYNLKYPEEAIKARVNIRIYYDFVVEADGSVTNINFSCSHVNRDSKNPDVIAAHDACLKAAYEIVASTSGMWEPAKKDGLPVRAEMSLPVWFKFY